MKYFKIVILLCCFFGVLGLKGQDSISDFKMQNTAKKTTVSVTLSDTLQVKNITPSTYQTPFYERNMHWIIALLIGLVSAFANLLIAFRLRQSNERIIQKQIMNAKETTLFQFKATIGTKNRQEWINDLRLVLSEFLTYTTYLSPRKHDEVKEDEIKRCIEKIFFTKFKIQLLTNPEKLEQKKLLDAIENMLNVITADKEKYNDEDMRLARQEIVFAARELFKQHWNKIKDLR